MDVQRLVGKFVISLDGKQDMVWAGLITGKDNKGRYTARKIIYEIGDKETEVRASDLENKRGYLIFDNQEEWDKAIEGFRRQGKIVKHNCVKRADFYGNTGSNLMNCLEGWMNG